MKLPAIKAMAAELAATRRRPAKMVSTGLMDEASIAEALRGTAPTATVRAIEALLTQRLIDLSDIATDRPRSTLQLPDKTIPGYTMEERLHDAGGAAHMADILARLQELTKAKEEAAS